MNKDFDKYAIKHLGINSNILGLVKASVGTPMILEERELRMTQMSVFDRMMMDRIIWISGPIENRMASVIQAQLMYLNSIDKKDIMMHIDTPGGSVLSGLGIRDVMNYIESDVATINLGMCASMGSILLSSGTKGKRSSLLFSKVMTHHVSSQTDGVIDDQRISLMEAEKYNYMLFKILAENCNKTFDEVHEISNRDKWFNSDEALKFGLIDEIIGVNKNITMSNMMEGFEDYYKKYVLK